MKDKSDRDIKPKFEDEDTQKQKRTYEPGRTPGKAEGTEEDVWEALRREERKREH